MPWCMGQLSPCATATEPTCSRALALQQEKSTHAAARVSPHAATKKTNQLFCWPRAPKKQLMHVMVELQDS